jgi:dTDP-4-amino-4,6-dideoxygalactose transaminase
MRIPFGTLTITQKAEDLVMGSLKSGRVSCGKLVSELEESFANKLGVKEVVAVSSGTDALALALSVLYDFGAKRGDEVIVPALSFVATGNAILQAGFVPVFVDINRHTLNIDCNKIEEKISDRTVAIMPVHLMGKPVAMDSILEIANIHNLYVIEDAAEAHGAEYKGRKIGTIGDMTAYSLYVAHIITSIEGGIVSTNREDFAEILRSLRSHGRVCKCKICVLNTNSAYCSKRFKSKDFTDARFQFERIGFSSKMNELEAAVGLGNLDIFDEILEKKRKNLLTMIDRLQDFNKYLYTVSEESYEKIGPHAFPIILKENVHFTRDQLVEHMEKAGIDTRNLFLSIPTQCSGFEFLGHKLGDYPEAEYIGNNGVHIGVHQDIGVKEIDYVMETIGEFIMTTV